MELGLRGRKAIVCASSRGLGKACALALAREGACVIINGRDEAALSAARDEIAATGAEVSAVAADVSTREGQDALIAACPKPDILVNNNGGPPLRDFRELDREAMISGVIQNMVTPIELIQRVVPYMVAQGFGRIVNITSISVRMPILGLDLSSGARAGLTAFMAGPARDLAKHNVTVNNLLPGMFDTDRLRNSTRPWRRWAARVRRPWQPSARRRFPPAASARPMSLALSVLSCAARRRVTSPARASSSTAGCSTPSSTAAQRTLPLAATGHTVSTVPLRIP